MLAQIIIGVIIPFAVQMAMSRCILCCWKRSSERREEKKSDEARAHPKTRKQEIDETALKEKGEQFIMSIRLVNWLFGYASLTCYVVMDSFEFCKARQVGNRAP